MSATGCTDNTGTGATNGKWLFCSAGTLFCYLSCQLWKRSAVLYGAEHSGK